MHQYFQNETCVLACSGPSLNNVDVFSLNLPVVAVSTAIRKISNPNFWALADNLNNMHGEEGKLAWNDVNIPKVIPDNKAIKSGTGFIPVRYSSSGKQGEITNTLFDPNYPLLRGPHKTVTFAIQWLHVNGIKNIIFAGNDLKAETFETKYAYKLEQFDMKKRGNFQKTLNQVERTLAVWYPIAKQKGFEWYSWKCGHVFENMVPSFTEQMEIEFKQKNPIKKIFNTKENIITKTDIIPHNILKTSQKTLINNILKINELEWKQKCKEYLYLKTKYK